MGYTIWNLYQQEEQAEAEAAAAAGEDPYHLNAYNRRLRATQSPNKWLCGFDTSCRYFQVLSHPSMWQVTFFVTRKIYTGRRDLVQTRY